MTHYRQPKMTCEHCGTRFLPGSHFVCGGQHVATVEGLAFHAQRVYVDSDRPTNLFGYGDSPMGQ